MKILGKMAQTSVWKYVYGCVLTIYLFGFSGIMPAISKSFPFLVVLTVLELWALYQCEKTEFQSVYAGKLYRIAIILGSAYMTFSVFGINLFWEGYELKGNLWRFVFFALSMLWCIPVFAGVWEWLYSFANGKNRRELRIKHSFVMPCLILAIGMGLYVWAYNPCILSADVSAQLSQIIEGKYESHALLHTLFLKAIWQTTNCITLVPIIQIVLIILMFYVVERHLDVAYLGKKRNVAYLLLVCNFVVGVMLTNVWKDSLFTCVLLLLEVVCAKLATDETARDKWSWSVLLGVSMATTWLIRLNGVFAVLAVAILLAVLCIKNKKRYWKPLVAIVVSFMFVFFFKNVVEDAYDFYEYDEGRITIRLMHTMAAVVVEDGFEGLDDETAEVFASICDLNTWKTNYHPYDTDTYSFGTEGWLDKVNQLEPGNVITAFMRNYFRHPIWLTMSRMNGAESLWNVTQAEGSFNYIYDNVITENDQETFGFVRTETELTDLANDYYAYLVGSPLLNTLFLRQGVWINVLLIGTLFCILTKRKIGWMTLPVWANIFSLLVAMGCQHSRYVWFVCISTVAFILALLVDVMKNDYPANK